MTPVICCMPGELGIVIHVGKIALHTIKRGAIHKYYNPVKHLVPHAPLDKDDRGVIIHRSRE